MTRERRRLRNGTGNIETKENIRVHLSLLHKMNNQHTAQATQATSTQQRHTIKARLFGFVRLRLHAVISNSKHNKILHFQLHTFKLYYFHCEL